jgi:hypothetical protein
MTEQLGPFAQTRLAHASTISPSPARDEYGRGVAARDELDVTLQLAAEPREGTGRVDLVEALDTAPQSRRFFDGLSYTQQALVPSGVSIERRKPLMA